MRKRPLCVALVIVVVILFLWRLLGEENLNGEYKGGKKYLTCQVTEISGQSDQISLTAEDVTEGEIPFCFRVKLYNGSREALFSKIKIGNIISVYGEVVSFSKPGNPGQFNEYQYYSEQKISYRVFVQSLTIKDSGYNKIKQWLHEIRGVFFRQMNRVLPEREAGIMSAMLLGEKCALTEEIKELYQENGIAHILAISGVKTLKLGIPLVPETRINWAFVPLHIVIIYILKLCLGEEIIPRCRFPCSRGYLTKYINWQKKQSFSVSQSYRKS